jgi:hypothetical protein
LGRLRTRDPAKTKVFRQAEPAKGRRGKPENSGADD